MGAYIANIAGQGLGACFLWWPLCYLAIRGTFKLDHNWSLFLIGFALASSLSAVGVHIVQFTVPADFQGLGKALVIPLISSLTVLLAYISLRKISVAPSSDSFASVKARGLNGWQRIGVLLTFGWFLYVLFNIDSMFDYAWADDRVFLWGKFFRTLFIPILIIWSAGIIRFAWIWVATGFIKGD